MRNPKTLSSRLTPCYGNRCKANITLSLGVGIRMREKVLVSGGEVATEVRGDGPAVVLVHGTLLNFRSGASSSQKPPPLV